jgi:protein involved in ribonucleotide reduction
MSSYFTKTTLFFYFLCCITVANAQNSVSTKIKKSNLYAGIEVGSKGVKMSILQVGKNAAATGAIKAIKDTSVNTDFISFINTTFSGTLNALTGLYNVALNSYGIPSSKIFTVVSSGVKGQAEKENKMGLIKNLADSFRLSIKEPQRLVPVIDAMEEARLSHIGIIPEARRYSTFLIDIGSGNTKGGYFKNGNTTELKLFVLNWGTKSIANATEKRIEEDKTITNYKKQLSRVIAGEPDKDIVYAVNESGAYNMNDNFAISGGIAWSVATLLYPELIENSVVPVNYEDLVKFNDRLFNNFGSLSPDKLATTIEDISIDKNVFITEAQRVHKVFDQKSLMAGSALLLKIFRQFEGVQEKKHFFLVKNGQVGWISAYVNQEIKTN